MNENVKSPYDFENLGEQLAKALLQAAQDYVNEANRLMSDTQVLADGIMSEVRDHAEVIRDRHERLGAFGASILDAHRKYLEPTEEPADTLPVVDGKS